jgi:urease accessory protein
MKRLSTAAAAALGATMAATPGLAHHPLAGAPMETLAQGLLSGLGHPVLGFDHLFFVAAVGVLAVFTGRAFLAPLGFIAGMLAGCVLIMAGVALPLVELAIAASLVILGAILMSGRALGLAPAMALFAGLGLFHGWAYGETITGQEGGMGAAVVAGYLIGLAAVQWAIAVAAGWAVSAGLKAASADALRARLAGGVVAGVGALLALEFAEGAAFAAMGIG